MKKWTKIVLLVLAAVILLPVIGLAIAGAMPDSNHMLVSVVIQRKPEEVWPWLYRKEHVMKWVSWLVEMREDSAGDPYVGKSGVWVMEDENNNNERVEFTGTVQAVDPYRRLNIKLDAPGGFQGTTEYRLTALPDGSTRFDSDSRYVFESAFARFMAPLIYWQARKKMAGDMERLKELIEAAR